MQQSQVRNSDQQLHRAFTKLLLCTSRFDVRDQHTLMLNHGCTATAEVSDSIYSVHHVVAFALPGIFSWWMQPL
jgi:hypothetical protein